MLCKRTLFLFKSNVFSLMKLKLFILVNCHSLIFSSSFDHMYTNFRMIGTLVQKYSDEFVGIEHYSNVSMVSWVKQFGKKTSIVLSFKRLRFEFLTAHVSVSSAKHSNSYLIYSKLGRNTSERNWINCDSPNVNHLKYRIKNELPTTSL